MQTTESNGTTIGYESHGSGEQLVLVHGSTASSDAWDPHLPHLADAGELVALDRRGRAASGDAAEYDLELAVDDVERVLDAVDASRLFGHSFGGLCALNAAEREDVQLEKLVLTGEQSPTFLQDAARAVHDRLPRGRLVEIEGVGHAGVENPPAVAEPVLEFLAE